MRFQSVKFEKVKLTAAIIGIGSCLFAEFMVYRPNRLAAGESVSFLTIGARWEIVLMLLLCAGIGCLSFLKFRYSKQCTFAFANILIILVFLAAGQYANSISGGVNPYARASLGIGFWLILFVSIIAIMESFQGGEKSFLKRLLYILIPFLLISGIFATGHLNQISLVKEFFNRQDRFYSEGWTHLALAFSSVGLSAFWGIPLGILLAKKPALESRSFFILNIIQTIPSIALFGLLIAPLAYISIHFDWLQKIGFQGIGWAPAVIALFLYALLPIVRNTYAGFKSIESSVIEAALGMGMSSWQILLRVELPLISPVLLNGIRIAAVQSVGNTAVAALIGAGGFGVFIFQGLGQAATSLILLGAIPTIIIAIFTDLIMQETVELVQPRRVK